MESGKRKWPGMAFGIVLGFLILVVSASIVSSFQLRVPKGNIEMVERQFRRDVFYFDSKILEKINNEAMKYCCENDSVEDIANAFTNSIMMVAEDKVKEIGLVWNVSSAEIKKEVNKKILDQIEQQRIKGQQFKLSSVMDLVEDNLRPIKIHFIIGRVGTSRTSESIPVICPFATKIFIRAVPENKNNNFFDHWEILNSSLVKINESKQPLLEILADSEQYVIAYFR